VQVHRRDERLHVEGERLRLGIELERLALSGTSRDGRTRFQGARAGVDLGERRLLAGRAEITAEREMRSAGGDAIRIQIRSAAERLELGLEIDVADRWPGALLRLSVRNGGERSLRVRRLLPFVLDAEERGSLALPFDARALRLLRMGYQSWTPAEYLPLGGREPRPRAGFLRRMHQGPFTPAAARGEHVSDFVTTLRSRETPALTVGFVSHHRFLTYTVLRHEGGQVRSLEAAVATEDLEVAPGEEILGERLWVGLDEPGADGLAEWAERTGQEMGALVPARVGTAWCSWYQFFTRVTAEDITRNLRALEPFRRWVETVQIDDGFQVAVGDWLRWSPGFPAGLEALGSEIRAAGFRAGVWLAPFLASRASRLAREHPDWLLRDEHGRPIVAVVNPAWRGRVCYALDPTHPGALEWLGEVVSTLRRAGFDYLKLDFLYAALLAGLRHSPREPSAAAYRGAIERIRVAAGPGAFLLGCGAPLGPSVGLFDAMRIGPDVAPKWRSRVADAAAGLPAAPSARNAVRNVLTRAPLHQRLWVNDPDCVLLRDRDTRLSDEEVRTVAAAAFVSGGLLALSDDLANLSPGRLQLLRRLLPPLGTAPRTGPLEGSIPDVLLQPDAEGGVLLFIPNLGERRRSRLLDLSAAGLGGPFHAYDVWADRYLGLKSGPLEVGPIPAHGCALLRLASADGQPRVVGSTLHLSAGATEVASIARDESGGVRLRLKPPGCRRGRLLVDRGASRPVAVPVDLDGSLEVLVPAVQSSERA
jgi:alpha-galactosidase